MMIVDNKQIGFIYKNNKSIDKILKDGDVVFEKGFLRERTSTTLPINFGGVGKDLKDYKIYGNTYQNSTSGKNICLQANIIDKNTIRFDINSNEINRIFTLSLIPPLSVNSMSIVAFADGVNLRSVGTINLISGERSTAAITLTESIYNTIQNASKVHFNLYKSGAGISTTSIIEEPQIENNSSFTSYEPYTGGQPSPNPDYPQEIISCGDLITDSQDENYGKYKIPVNVRSDNLLELFANSTASYGIKSTLKENGSLDITGTATANNNSQITGNIYNNIKPGTYTFCLSEPLDSQIYIHAHKITGSFDNYAIQVGNTFKTFTTVKEYDYYNIRYSVVSGQTYNLNIKMQLVEGSTVPDKYIPYYNETTNIYLDEPLRKIDGYSDYIDFINGKIVRNIKEIVLDGSEDWYTSSRTSQVAFNKGVGYIHDTTKLPCNISSNCQMPNNNLYFYNTGYSLADWKTFLSITNAIVYGRLSTPTEEDIELPNISTIDGNNTLNIETEITPSQVYIKYKSNE